mmetsp:Transcript_16411/g.33856  ORF Transcript_16411/g.33856 Transcript_16411/m.33856 type:complete len:228 (-) Transcript_16411:201-884(-)|eukprot:CAMPEP_0172439652 /NCGR_PEP_ID=MMETSP1065-20121228/565_1 /TAXON_ID=265537 /ORGANISM="Amphiprora paludosa, Strain CCMP125" /LENGTH=227 /DNA_ID=CAMNT_0013188365 /DNA_START=193 /DNA_END=876 /DNA_ORIENTATION=+
MSISSTDSASPSPGPRKRTIAERINREDFQKLERHCAKRPEEVARLEKYNIFSAKSEAYPLHYLCHTTRNCPVSTLRAFIQAAPKALIHQDPVWKSTPLHFACSNRLSVACVRELIQACPQALAVPDVDGKLPVHVAATHAEPEVVMELWNAHPTNQVTHKGQTVLHLAVVRSDPNSQVVKTLHGFFDAQQEFKTTTRTLRQFKGLRRILQQKIKPNRTSTSPTTAF